MTKKLALVFTPLSGSWLAQFQRWLKIAGAQIGAQ